MAKRKEKGRPAPATRARELWGVSTAVPGRMLRVGIYRRRWQFRKTSGDNSMLKEVSSNQCRHLVNDWIRSIAVSNTWRLPKPSYQYNIDARAEHVFAIPDFSQDRRLSKCYIGYSLVHSALREIGQPEPHCGPACYRHRRHSST
jgi:hypothetical protein